MSYNFIHRILHAEIAPPASCWEKIAGELGKPDAKNFVARISSASVEPPALVWDRISASLNSSRSGKPSFAFWMKWSAAALVAGGLIIAASLLFTSQKNEITAAGKTPGKESSNNSASAKPTVNPSAANPGSNDSSVVVAQNDITTINNNPLGPKLKSPLVPVRHAAIEPSPADNDVTQLNESSPSISDNVSPDAVKYIPAPDYYIVTAPNGESAKISSKFSNAVVSLMGGDNVDYLWKSRFDNWKAKLISSPTFIPAAGNFLDIAELKDLIKEQ